MEKLAIRHVVRLGDVDDLQLYETHEGVGYHTICIEDSVRCHMTHEILDGAIEFIKQANTPVLIHCKAGVSRSASVAIAYIMQTENKTFRDARLFVKEKRQCISPNGTFMKDLFKYQEKIKERVSKH